MTEYFFIKNEEEILVRKEVDVNFDKKFDVVRSFNKKRELLMERMDTDFDGRVDVVSYFEAGALVRKEYDTNFDNKVDLWRFFEEGNIVKKEADLNYDGDIDYWEYFEAGKFSTGSESTETLTQKLTTGSWHSGWRSRVILVRSKRDLGFQQDRGQPFFATQTFLRVHGFILIGKANDLNGMS